MSSATGNRYLVGRMGMGQPLQNANHQNLPRLRRIELQPAHHSNHELYGLTAQIPPEANIFHLSHHRR